MATFFQPPPPFVGGSQPLANHGGNIPSEAVAPQAPFMHPAVGIAIQVALSAWVPPDPAPILARNLNPALTAVRVSNPPFSQPDQNLAIVAGAWIDAPLVPFLARNAIIIPPVSSRSISQPASALCGILGTWVSADPAAILVRNLNPAFTAVPVSNLPFSQRNQNLAIAAGAWVPPDPAATLARNANPALTAVPVSNPPFSQPDQNLAIVAEDWVPPDPGPILARNINPSITAVPVNNPPFSQAEPGLYGVLGSWNSAPPLPILPGNGQIITGTAPVVPVVVQTSLPGPSDGDEQWRRWLEWQKQRYRRTKPLVKPRVVTVEDVPERAAEPVIEPLPVPIVISPIDLARAEFEAAQAVQVAQRAAAEHSDAVRRAMDQLADGLRKARDDDDDDIVFLMIEEDL